MLQKTQQQTAGNIGGGNSRILIHGGGGSANWHFDRANRPDFTNSWKHNIFDCCSYPAISAEIFCGCHYCWYGKIFNVLSNASWTEADSCCNQGCAMPCLFDFCVYGMGCIYTAMMRCGVANRSQIQENGCSSCIISSCLVCCSTNQMAYELTSRGEFPGGVACANRPRGIPNRPPPPQPQVLGLPDVQMRIQDQTQVMIQALQQQMFALQTQVQQTQNGQWTDDQTRQYHALNGQVIQLQLQQQQQMQTMMTMNVLNGGAPTSMVVAGDVQYQNNFQSSPNTQQRQAQVNYSGNGYYSGANNNNNNNNYAWGVPTSNNNSNVPPPPPPPGPYSSGIPGMP